MIGGITKVDDLQQAITNIKKGKTKEMLHRKCKKDDTELIAVHKSSKNYYCYKCDKLFYVKRSLKKVNRGR